MPKAITPMMILPEEAVALFQHADYETLRRAAGVKNEFVRANQEMIKQNPNVFLIYMAACIWNAGRVQGIREERKRRREKSLV